MITSSEAPHERPLHPVSCKAAVYSPDGERVLVMEYFYPGRKGYGLPGGHLEKDELPDQAIERELIEEVGEDFRPALQRKDFWVHEDGKVVLGYTAVTESEVLPPPPDPQACLAHWVLVSQVASGAVDTGSYAEFIITNRPEV